MAKGKEENKEEKKTTETMAVSESATNQKSVVTVDRDTLLRAKEMSQLLKGFNKENAVELTSEYIDFEEGVEYLMVFAGMTTIKNQFKARPTDPDNIEAVRLIDDAGKFKVSADVMLVGTCRDWHKADGEPIATPILVVCQGKVNAKVGSYKKLSISKLY